MDEIRFWTQARFRFRSDDFCGLISGVSVWHFCFGAEAGDCSLIIVLGVRVFVCVIGEKQNCSNSSSDFSQHLENVVEWLAGNT